MLNVNCSNWEYDLYMRIDKEVYISYTLKNKYITEIVWCYRFGFIDEDQRDNLINYLEYMFDKVELDNLKQKNYFVFKENMKGIWSYLKNKSKKKSKHCF